MPGSISTHLRQLERKSETNLRLRKDAEGVTVMFSEKSRHCHFAESTGPCFRWNALLGMHVFCAQARERKTDAKALALRELAADVLKSGEDGPAVLRHKELVELVMAREECSERTAKGRVTKLVEIGLVGKRDDGTYLVIEAPATGPD
jgi:hypothetical protein